MTRLRYLGQRLLLAIPVVLFGITITFVVVRLGPLDPVTAILGPNAPPEQAARVRRSLGLTQPLWRQYLEYVARLLTFDLPRSWVVSPGTPALELVGLYAPRTIWLGFWSVLVALVVGVPLGFYAGLHPNTGGDYLASVGGIVWRAMPNFWLAIVVVSVLSQSPRLLWGFEWTTWLVHTPKVVTPPDLSVLARPSRLLTAPAETWPRVLAAIKMTAPAAIVLGSSSMGNEIRVARTAVLETVGADYVDAARAKGLPERRVVWKHVFRNALVPLVPIVTGEAFLLLGGSVLVETVFAINGLGQLFFRAAVQADLPLLGALMYVFVLVLVATNLLQDLLYTLVDPRVGFDRRSR
ncbi:MAG: ABC transporter permease [Haloferacaceae archaeon]